MKYERITRKKERQYVMTMWKGDPYFLKIYNRLAELEDKIESGELVERDEYIDRLMTAKDISGMTDKELEFFAKHNAKVRKEAVREFVGEFKSRHFFMMTTYMKDPIYQCTSDELDRLVKEVCGE